MLPWECGKIMKPDTCWSMPATKRLIILLIALLLGVLTPFNQTARAQSQQRLEVITVNSESFPLMRVQFELFDASGRFVTNLRANDVSIRENDDLLRPSNLELLRPGVQFIVAVNPAPEFTNRYAGVSRFEAIHQTLLEWVQAQPEDSTDQFSLATNTGLQIIHSRGRDEWLQAVEGLQGIDLLQERPSLFSLTRAVDLATDPNPESVMKRVILFITPLIPDASLEGLPNLIDRAVQQGVTVHVWLVGSSAAASSAPQAFASLERLAFQSGGDFFIFSGPEGFPEIEDYLDPARYVYRAQYESHITSSATHVIAVEVRRSDIQIRSAGKPVYLNVLPPNPIFLAPQSIIERKWVQGENPRESLLLPESVQMRIVVEYPDGKPRALKASRLYVDGVLVDQNQAEPFDVLEWQMGILPAGRYVLKAEVEDVLGLRQSSIDMPVTLSVEAVPESWWQTAFSGDRPLAMIAIVAAGLFLLFSVTLAGRGVLRAAVNQRAQARDPLTQPVPVARERIRRPRPKAPLERATWPRQAMAGLSSAPAWLVRMTDDNGNLTTASPSGNNGGASASAIPLTRREITLGNDELRAHYWLDSPSVSPVHARIGQTSEGGFRIQDAGSVTGTWVNYRPVPASGTVLQHGDIIHLGRVVFRFELANPPEIVQPKVRTIKDSLQ